MGFVKVETLRNKKDKDKRLEELNTKINQVVEENKLLKEERKSFFERLEKLEKKSGGVK